MGTTILNQKLTAVSDLIRLPKQYGTVLLLCPTLWALFLASGGMPQGRLIVIFTLGAFIMRSAGCAVNDIADRNFDSRVERTRTRPLADGRLTVPEALVVFALLTITAFGLVLLLDPLTIKLSVIGIILASTYPLVKRVSHFPQAFLGVAFGWGAVMAWSAVTGALGPECFLIFLANVFFATAYDTIYALMDFSDDLSAGVKSTAIYFGRRVYVALVVLYAGMLVTLWALGRVAGLGSAFYVGTLLAFIFLLAIVFRLKRDPSRERAMRGFLANAWAGVVVLLAIIIDLNF